MIWFVNYENIYEHLVDEDPAHRDGLGDGDGDQDDVFYLEEDEMVCQ